MTLWTCTLKVLWCQFGAVFFQIVVLIQLLSFSTETILLIPYFEGFNIFFFLFNQNKSQSSQIFKCCLNTRRHARTLFKLKILNQAKGWCQRKSQQDDESEQTFDASFWYLRATHTHPWDVKKLNKHRHQSRKLSAKLWTLSIWENYVSAY